MNNSIWRKSSYRQSNFKNKQTSMELEFDFLKIKFQNRGISLNSFRQWAFAGKFRRNGYFAILAHVDVILLYSNIYSVWETNNGNGSVSETKENKG